MRGGRFHAGNTLYVPSKGYQESLSDPSQWQALLYMYTFIDRAWVVIFIDRCGIKPVR